MLKYRFINEGSANASPWYEISHDCDVQTDLISKLLKDEGEFGPQTITITYSDGSATEWIMTNDE